MQPHKSELGNQFITKMRAFVLVLLSFAHVVNAGVYTHSEAQRLLNNSGITVTSTGGCSNKNVEGCTSLDGIHEEAIDEIITLKRAVGSGCDIIVTGGTEIGHPGKGNRSHSNEWKLDIRK